MKKLIFIILLLTLFSCKEELINDVSVSFTAKSFESGDLKSFDIKDWKHNHYPYEVMVTMINTNTGVEYHSKAANASVFFKDGSEFVHIPSGTYNCLVSGGGYPKDSLTMSQSYYMWSIKDTTVFIGNSHETIIRFNLDKKSALVVKDYQDDIKLISYRNADLFWTGKGQYDFAYVTPGTYSGLYTDSLGNETNTPWFDIEPDNYYYFITPSGVKSTVTIPEFKKNEIDF